MAQIPSEIVKCQTTTDGHADTDSDIRYQNWRRFGYAIIGGVEGEWRIGS